MLLSHKPAHNQGRPNSNNAIAELYRRGLLLGCAVLVPGGLLYDAYLAPGPLVPVSRYAMVVVTLALVGASISRWLNARDTIRAAIAIAFVYMGHMALALWDSQLDPVVLSGVFLSALAIGSTLHSERLIVLFHLGSGAGLMLAVSLTPVDPLYRTLIAFYIVAFVLLMAVLATAAMRSKIQLYRSEEVMNAVFENASDALLYAETKSGNMLRSNLQARTLLETDNNAVIGELVRTAFLAAQPKSERANAIRSALNDPLREQTIKMYSAKRNQFFGRLTARRIKVGNDDLTLIRINDTTATQLENQALEQTRRVLDRSQELAQLGGWEFDTTSGSWSYTDVAEKILDLQSAPTTVGLIRMFRNPEQQQQTIAAFRRIVGGDTGFDVIAEVETTTGKRLSLHILAEPVMENGKVVRVFGVFADVSAHREREQALQVARDAAESAARARSLFLANMSHEIRTPMNGVIGMASLLAGTQLDQQQSAYVETIRTSGESLLHILNEILDFSKIDADQVVLENRAFELEKCLFDALTLVTPAAAEKGLEVLCQMDKGSRAYFYGDALRLRQVLVNLLSNAIKFTEFGEILLHARYLDAADDSGPTLQFSVTDTGIGVPADRVPQLFEPFTQADSSTTRRYGGTGLGLSICRRLVELMGGEIRLESTAGSGSTFTFTVKTTPADLPSVLPDFAETPLRVLAVDDNKTNRIILQAMLATMNIKAEVHDHPHKARDHYATHGADLIITDMQMPDMDGLQLIQELRALHDSAQGDFPKSVLLSSLDATPRVQHQFDAVITKPARPSELQATLVSLLRNLPDTKPAKSDQQQELTVLPAESVAVLLAEDNLVNQTVAISILDKLGFTADIATNGREAYDMLQEHHYDIVLMDVQMPVLDGLEATRLIRADQSLRQPYIVAMTANAMREDRVACVQAGMDDFVAKPIRVRDVHTCLAIALESLDLAVAKSAENSDDSAADQSGTSS